MLYSCPCPAGDLLCSGSEAPQLRARRSGAGELRVAEREREACRGHKIKKPGMKSGY
jgi:hypothetical protein